MPQVARSPLGFALVVSLGVIVAGAAIAGGVATSRSEAIAPVPLMAAEVEALGLTWRECKDSEISTISTICPGTDSGEVSRGRPAVRIDGGSGGEGHWRLTTGPDTYDFYAAAWGPGSRFWTAKLIRNGRMIKRLTARSTIGYSPNVGFFELAGHSLLEFRGGPSAATIFFDGEDMRARFDLDGAFAPHILAGRLVFVGLKDGRYFLVVDGRRVGPDFEQVQVGGSIRCCMAGIFRPQGSERGYRFAGRRDGRDLRVEISTSQ